ncbi:MAG: hypothetical protein ACP5UT_11240 [Bryobacteraceae bacterium]
MLDVDAAHEAAKQGQAASGFVSGLDLQGSPNIVLIAVTGAWELPEAADDRGVTVQFAGDGEFQKSELGRDGAVNQDLNGGRSHNPADLRPDIDF